MMDNLRTAANSVVIKVIFGLIIVSFILTGVSGYLIGGNNNYAAKVNDQEIGRGQSENAVASERNRMQQQLGDQYSELAANENYIKSMRQQVLNRLIDEALLDSLRQLRKQLADRESMPAYIIFNDQSLADMVDKKPVTLDEFSEITGVGQIKLDKYGKVFVSLIRFVLKMPKMNL